MSNLTSYALSATVVLLGMTSKAQPVSTESKFKAMYLLNFTKYTFYPEGTVKDSFRVGILGDAEVLDNMEHLAETKRINGKPIAVSNLDESSDFCKLQLVFVSSKHNETLAQHQKTIKDCPVLFVSEFGDVHASMINFVMAGEQLKYELNIANAKSAHLSIGADLKNLATKVVE